MENILELATEFTLPDDAHPDINALYDYWRAIAPVGALPGRRHFDPVYVPRQLPNIWLLDVHYSPLRFWRRLVGSRIEQYAGESLQGGWVGENLPHGRQAAVQQNLAAVVETKQPNWRRGRSFIHFEKQDFGELERLYLPMAADGHSIDMILAITVFPDMPATFTNSVVPLRP